MLCQTPLHAASLKCHQQVVETLLEARAELLLGNNASIDKNDNGWTELNTHASFEGNSQVTSINHSADFNIKTNYS